MIDASELQTWLRESLGEPAIAARVAQLVADSSLDDDLRLLYFCHEQWPQMPAIWRGRTLDAANLAAAALAAQGGSEPDAQWIDSLADRRAFAFFAARGRADVAALGQRWADMQAQYGATWDAVIAMGGPAAARPPEPLARLITAHLAASEGARSATRDRARALLGPSEWLRRAPWFLQFGSDIDALGEARLEALQTLDGASLLAPPIRAHLDELGEYTPERLQTLRQGLLLSPLQEKCFTGLELAPGSGVVTLVQGQRHYPKSVWTLGRELRYRLEAAVTGARRVLGAFASAAWRRIRQTARGAAEPPEAAAATTEAAAAPAAIPATVEVRMVPVQLRFNISAAPLQATLARVSWSAPDKARIRFRLTHLEGWPAWPLLNLRHLPNQGQFLVLLFTSTRVQLKWRERGWRWLQAEPIDIWLRECEQPSPAAEVGHRLNAGRGLLKHALPAMAAPSSAHVGEQSLREMRGGMVAPPGSHDLLPPDGSAMRCAVSSTRLARPLTRFEAALRRRWLARATYHGIAESVPRHQKQGPDDEYRAART